MKKLNKKEMAKVSGGVDSYTGSREEIARHKGSPVSKYDGIEGNNYIFEYGYHIIVGKLIRTYEDEVSIYGDTKRKHDVLVCDNYVYYDGESEVGNTVTLDGDVYDMFEYVD